MAGQVEGGGPPGRGRLANARRSQALDMQQSAFLQLMLSGVVLFALALLAAYILVVPRGVYSPKALAVTLGQFMTAGAENDALLGHSLLSVAGLRQYSEADVASLFAQRTFFEGFERVQLRSVDWQTTDTSGGKPGAAAVQATTFYRSAAPASLTATLALEEDSWRIAAIQISRAPTATSGP
jgi:hypothetical protein